VELMDLNGRRILTNTVPAGQTFMKIDVASRQLAAGVYMLKVHVGQVVVTKKIIKQ
jgi:hypothetical protein